MPSHGRPARASSTAHGQRRAAPDGPLARARQEAAQDAEQASRRVQEASVAYQLGQVSARGALAALREASRRARMAMPHEMVQAFAAVTAAREALVRYVGEHEAKLAEESLSYTPSGLR